MSRVRMPILARCSRMYEAIIDDMNGVSPNKRPRSEHRKKTREELWRDIRDQLYPDWIHMTEEEQETVENNFEINYFIALGANKSIPSTVTSNSQGNDGVNSSPLMFTGNTGFNYPTLFTAPVLYNPRRMYNVTPMYRPPAVFPGPAVNLGPGFSGPRYMAYPDPVPLSRSYEYSTASFREFTSSGGHAGDGESSYSNSLLQASVYNWRGHTQINNEIIDDQPIGYNYNSPSTSGRSSVSNDIRYGGYNTSRGPIAASTSGEFNNYNTYMPDWSYGMSTMSRENISSPLDLRPRRKRTYDYCQLDPLPPFSTLQRDVRTPQPSTSYYNHYPAPPMSRAEMMITMNGDNNNNVGDDFDPFQFAIEQSFKY